MVVAQRRPWPGGREVVLLRHEERSQRRSATYRTDAHAPEPKRSFAAKGEGRGNRRARYHYYSPGARANTQLDEALKVGEVWILSFCAARSGWPYTNRPIKRTNSARVWAPPQPTKLEKAPFWPLRINDATALERIRRGLVTVLCLCSALRAVLQTLSSHNAG